MDISWQQPDIALCGGSLVYDVVDHDRGAPGLRAAQPRHPPAIVEPQQECTHIFTPQQRHGRHLVHLAVVVVLVTAKGLVLSSGLIDYNRPEQLLLLLPAFLHTLRRRLAGQLPLLLLLQAAVPRRQIGGRGIEVRREGWLGWKGGLESGESWR